MHGGSSTLLILLIILSLGLIVPELFRRFKFPFVTSLILVGAIMGPFGLGIVVSNEAVEFLGFLGFTFLMLMAGLEINTEQMGNAKAKIAILAVANGAVPFIVGFMAMTLMGYDRLSAVMVATIFVSSSVAIIVPTMRSAGMFKSTEGQVMISSILVEDVLSLVILAVLFQSAAPITNLPTVPYILLLLFSIFFLKISIPAISRFFIGKKSIFKKRNRHEDELRFVIVVLISTLILFDYLGVHAIIASFFVGVLLSGVVTTEVMYSKLHTMAYGIFVPVFFFIIGMQMDLSSIVTSSETSLFILYLTVIFLVAKIGSGYFSARAIGIDKRHARFFGVISTPQLTTTVAATYAAASAGFLDTKLVTAIIALSIITTILAPLTLTSFPSFFGIKKREIVDANLPSEIKRV